MEIIISFDSKKPINNAPIPAISCIGTMSIDGYFLIIKISVEKEMGIINAAIFPTICPGDKEFPTIKIIPENANIIETKVSFGMNFHQLNRLF